MTSIRKPSNVLASCYAPGKIAVAPAILASSESDNLGIDQTGESLIVYGILLIQATKESQSKEMYMRHCFPETIWEVSGPNMEKFTV